MQAAILLGGEVEGETDMVLVLFIVVSKMFFLSVLLPWKWRPMAVFTFERENQFFFSGLSIKMPSANSN